jgi:quercetin dioxygenase-like cupin family protein
MAEDAGSTDTDGVEDGSGAAVEAEVPMREGGGEGLPEGEGEGFPYFVEVWNDYDPSMRFVSLFPVGEEQGATASSAAYYIIEPGRHTGLHSDNAEEVIFVAEGDGELFVLGKTTRLAPAAFIVIPAGMEHDIYAQGSVALRLLSFFPTTEIVSQFQQVILPMGGNVLSSIPPRPTVIELDPSTLPEDFPFDLAELGLAPAEPRDLTPSERLIGLTDLGEQPVSPAEGTGDETAVEDA